MALDHDERCKLDYKDTGDLIRHYSNVRSALTTFLLTVALAAFAAYTRNTEKAEFMIPIAHLLLVMSFVVCLTFSFRTEWMVYHQTELWNWSKDHPEDDPLAYPSRNKRPVGILLKKMCIDPMNWFLSATVILIVFFFNRDVVAKVDASTIRDWSLMAVTVVFVVAVMYLSGLCLAYRKLWPNLVALLFVILILGISYFETFSLIHSKVHFWEKLAGR